MGKSVEYSLLQEGLRQDGIECLGLSSACIGDKFGGKCGRMCWREGQ